VLIQVLRMGQAAWRYRGFVAGSVRREFTARYRSSLLGAAWAVLSPLAMVVVYMLVFSRVMRMRLGEDAGTLDYGIYLCAGVLAWSFFAEVVQRSSTMFGDHAGLLKRMSFPRICLPVIVVANALMNFAIIFAMLVLVLALAGEFPGPALLAAVPVMAILCLFATGVGIVSGILNVFFRDTGQLLGIVLQVWFWFTPIVYPLSVLPEALRPVVAANPLTALVTAQQTIVLGAGWPDWGSLLAPLAVALLVAMAALALFRRRVAEIVDEL
jgi:lipopolysaccharide transport system permease protein